MGRSLRVRLHPLDQLRIFQRLAYTAAGDEQDVSRRTIGEGIVGHDLLPEGGMNRLAFFRDAIDFEACFAKDFPGPGVIDNFRAIEQEHSYADPLLLVIDFLDQRHPATGARARFVEGKLVTFLPAFGTDKDMFWWRGRSRESKRRKERT